MIGFACQVLTKHNFIFFATRHFNLRRVLAAFNFQKEQHMTSDAAGVKRIYYHGGKAGLPVGGYILPAAETGYTELDRRLKENFGEYYEDVYDMNLVYTTTQAEWAIPYAVVCNGWVYEVEPEGEISSEQDELGQPTGFRCSRARIVSRVQIPSYRSRHVLVMLRAGRTMVDCYFWLLDDEDAAAPLEPPPGLSRLKREMWKKKARKGTL